MKEGMKSEVQKFLKGKALTTFRTKAKFYLFDKTPANRVYVITEPQLIKFVNSLSKEEK